MGVWEAGAEVPIQLAPAGANAREPTTVGRVFRATVARHGDALALRVKRGESHAEWTWREYYEQSAQFARALVRLGVSSHAAVNILGFNAPEWLIADVGAILAGGMAAGIYGSNGPEACRYISAHSRAPVVVVDSVAQLDKYVAVADQLPDLRFLVIWGPVDDLQELSDRVRRASAGRVALHTFEAFLRIGELGEKDEGNDPLEPRIQALRPGHCCTLVYTSGTTGPPKAVMTSHDNLTWMSRSVPDVFPGIGAHSRAISFLPLSHVAAQMMDIHLPMFLGCPVTFAAPNALKGGGLLETLTDVRPSFILAVPRVWEKIMEALQAKLSKEQSKAKRALINWAFTQGTRRMHRLQHHKTPEEEEEHRKQHWWPWWASWWAWLSGSFQYALANALLLSKIRHAMGLDACNYCVTGAAPISTETLEFYGQLGISLYECFGQSETTGPHTSTSIGRWKIGTTGPAWPGTSVRIDPETGEVQSQGRQVFMGYLNDQESTEKALRSDGWFASGDIGQFDNKGYLSITGRLKELIITAGGENIPPVLIEDALQSEMSALSHVVVIGDRRKYLTFLCTLRVKPDDHGAPTDELDHIALQVAKDVGSPATTVTQARKCEKFKQYITEGMKRANERATSNAQRVQKFVILPRDFSIDSGELTPTLKIKRAIVYKTHSEEIEALYA